MFLLTLLALQTSPALIEVPIRHVYFPSQGYDESDNIQLVIEGELPDPCYVPGRQVAAHDTSGIWTLHQYAWRRPSGLCDSGDLLGESPYSEEVSLGLLKPGDYKIEFNPDDNSVDYRHLHVETGRAPAPEEREYALVSALEVPAFALEGQSLRVKLEGKLASPCHQLKNPVKVERQGDTIVIHPVQVRLDTCESPVSGYETWVELGVLPPGKYLIHARSGSGGAQQKTVTVVRTHLPCPAASR